VKPGLPLEAPSHTPPPKRLQGYVSVAAPAGKSVFGRSRRAVPRFAKTFCATKSNRDAVARTLDKAGFVILFESPLGFAVSAPPAAYEDLCGGTVQTRERLMHAECGRMRYVTHVDIVGDHPKAMGVGRVKSKAAKMDGVLIERPRVFLGMFPSPLPPQTGRFHLRVPDDVALSLSAKPVHNSGQRGDGVTVAMPDSGFYAHPFFMAHGYNVQPGITAIPGSDPQKDPVGHGTGEAANVFATAPGAVLQPIRVADDGGRLVGSMAGFLAAKQLKPRVITCSWGGDDPFPPPGGPDAHELAFAMEIRNAVEEGIVVVFAAGNGGFSIEPQVSGVIAAGGVHMSLDLQLRASDYASGYASPWVPGRTVPTVCGLVGLAPRAQYLMLPVPPGSMIDEAESRPEPPADPEGDGTGANDGWALFSGTSAAAPQIAGVAALLLGAKPNLTPAQVSEALAMTAVDVTSGRCHRRFDNLAGPGLDAATGAGLVNAQAALDYARSHF
jgi:subtilisin family serine protease